MVYSCCHLAGRATAITIAAVSLNACMSRKSTISLSGLNMDGLLTYSKNNSFTESAKGAFIRFRECINEMFPHKTFSQCSPPSRVRTIVPFSPLAQTTASLTALMPRRLTVTPLSCISKCGEASVVGAANARTTRRDHAAINISPG